jgi:hypothetical protein
MMIAAPGGSPVAVAPGLRQATVIVTDLWIRFLSVPSAWGRRSVLRACLAAGLALPVLSSAAAGPPLSLPFGVDRSGLPHPSGALRRTRFPGRALALPYPCGLSVVASLLTRASLLLPAFSGTLQVPF